ncbi:MAG: urease accessory protein UreD [Planctomycetota bacterium]|jgi:urease accessory protein|nr:urease accessory protein UreD [Planctomycetota bacterium]
MADARGDDRNWAAELELGFAAEGGRTNLGRLAFWGPLRVQRLFHPEGGGGDERLAEPAHCYILHPPGGLVSGDDLRIVLEAGGGAHALATTPSAGKIYRAAAGSAVQRQRVEIAAAGGAIEWLPRETIVFSGARAELSLTARLSGGGRFIGRETLILGRAAGDLPFAAGRLNQSFRLEREGVPILLERLEFAAGDALANGAFGLGGAGILMGFWAAGSGADASGLRRAAAIIKERLAEMAGGGRADATFRDGVAVVRYLGNDARQADRVARLAWEAARPVLLGRPVCPPRIWNL